MGFNFQKVDESNIWPTKQSNFTRPENRVQNKTIRDQISEKRQKRTYGHLEQVDGDILFLKKNRHLRREGIRLQGIRVPRQFCRLLPSFRSH